MEEKKRKNPIQFCLQLNDEQKIAKALIIANEISIINGAAGSGKTLTACQVGLDGLFTGLYSQLIIARPAVTAGEDLGFLPGSLNDKLLEFMQPIMDNFNRLYGDTTHKRDKIKKHIDNGEISIVSIAHLRGRSFTNAFVIIDEAQNLTEKQIEMVVTRLGKNSKMVITGDLKQTDLKQGITSGLYKLISLVDKIKGLVKMDLKENHRSGIVKEIIQHW